MVILDTNIIIDHLRQKNKTSYLEELAQTFSKESLSLSVISVQELYEGKSTEEENKENYLLATIAPLKIVPYTYEIAQKAGEIARDLKNSIELADAAIAATAILHGYKLCTLNKKDFLGIKDLELYKNEE